MKTAVRNLTIAITLSFCFAMNANAVSKTELKARIAELEKRIVEHASCFLKAGSDEEKQYELSLQKDSEDVQSLISLIKNSGKSTYEDLIKDLDSLSKAASPLYQEGWKTQFKKANISSEGQY